MFYPFRIEHELKSGEPLFYFAKLIEPGVIDIINLNKALTKQFSDIVDEAFLPSIAESCSNFDSYAQWENEEIEQDQFESTIQFDSSTNGNLEMTVILRHRMQKSDTTVWPIYFLMMKLMPKLGH